MQSQQHLGAPHDDVEGKIFVGGLSWQTTEESMRFHFEKFGELSDIAIMIDKRTGQPRYIVSSAHLYDDKLHQQNSF